MCDFRVWLALYREPRAACDFSSSLTEGESCVGAFFSAHKKEARTISVMNLFSSMQEIGLITSCLLGTRGSDVRAQLYFRFFAKKPL